MWPARARARARVISTPELLKHTLTYLPMRDLLLVAPLVSKTWLAITLSPALQRALFFHPDPTVTDFALNPLLVELFPPFFTPEGNGTRGRLRRPGDAFSIKTMPWAKVPDTFKRADASWRRMLVTQPPAQTMVIAHRTHSQGGDYEQRAVLRDLSLRMGVLWDVAMPFANYGSQFCVRWHHGLDEGDLTLAVWSTQTCIPTVERRLDERFDSEGTTEVEINFGERVYVDNRNDVFFASELMKLVADLPQSDDDTTSD